MIKTKRKGKNRKSSFDDEGFVKFRISISSFHHLLQLKSHCTLHASTSHLIYYNERIFRKFVLSKEKKKNWRRKIYLELKFEFLGKIESQFSNPRFYSNYADRIAFPVA